MTLFFTSDTHFGHARINELANRPFSSVAEADAAMVERWNATVAPDDVVYHLGDVALGKIAESLLLVKRLNGTKILIRGNHDRPFIENYHMQRAHAKGNAAKRDKHFDRYADFMDFYHECGFADIYPSHEVEFGGWGFLLSHFPYDRDSHGEDRYVLDRLPDEDRVPLIHGHTHGRERLTISGGGSIQIHVGVDAWDYTPVSEFQILALLEQEGPHSSDA